MISSVGQTRLAFTFQRSRSMRRAALIGYMMAGDPNLDASLDAMFDLVENGVDIIELGFPFTDPMADGPIIQRANLRALDNNVSLAMVLELIGKFRQKNTDTPVVLMGYANPVHLMGYDNFAAAVKSVGVDGVILVDIPLEESSPIEAALANEGVALIRLAAPTASPSRLLDIAKNADGFVYMVSVAGVTGDKSADVSSKLAAQIEHLRFTSGKPICLGFGIKTPADVAQAAKLADGVVVGSGIVRFSEEMAKPDANYEELRGYRNEYVRQLSERLYI